MDLHNPPKKSRSIDLDFKDALEKDALERKRMTLE